MMLMPLVKPQKFLLLMFHKDVEEMSTLEEAGDMVVEAIKEAEVYCPHQMLLLTLLPK